LASGLFFEGYVLLGGETGIYRSAGVFSVREDRLSGGAAVTPVSAAPSLVWLAVSPPWYRFSGERLYSLPAPA